MLKLSVSRFSIPIWIPFIFLASILFLGLHNYTTLPTHTWRQQRISPSHDRLAKQVSASDLLKRPLANNTSTIPKIYHQSWMSPELPVDFQFWSDSCRSLHPDWEWVLWTDEDNANLVRMHFPWLEESYNALPAEIYRADLARSLYMYAFGG